MKTPNPMQDLKQRKKELELTIGWIGPTFVCTAWLTASLLFDRDAGNLLIRRMKGYPGFWEIRER